MRRRTLLLGLVALLAVAVATPALGNGESLLTRALGIAKAAERKAEAAKRKSNTAKRKSNVAKRKSNAAKRIARRSRRIARRRARPGPPGPRGPQGVPGPVGPPGAGAATAFAEAPGSVTATTTDYEALAGGPSVTVDVPPPGLVQVAAQATLSASSDDDGAVALYADGALVPGQAGCDPSVALFNLPAVGDEVAGGTPATLPFCGTLGPPAPVMLQVEPGERTLELRYAVCGCGAGDATFSDRRLWVTPLPGPGPAPAP